MAMNPQKIKDKSGFILAEVILTVIILSVGLTAIIQSYLMGLRAYVMNKDYAIATSLLDNKLYELMQEGPLEDGKKEEEHFQEPYDNFKYTLESHAVKNDDRFQGLSEVRLTVSWMTGHKNNQILVTTFLLGGTP